MSAIARRRGGLALLMGAVLLALSGASARASTGYRQAGSFEAAGVIATGLAVDQSSAVVYDGLYANPEFGLGHVGRFDSSGVSLGQFGSARYAGVAVDQATRHIYALDGVNGEVTMENAVTPEAERHGSLVTRAVVLCMLLAIIAAGSGFAPASASACPNEALRSGPSAGLPDCRAYELLSTEKDDADAMLSPLVTASHSSFAGFGLAAAGSVLWDTGFVWPYGGPSNGVDNVHQGMRATGECSSGSPCWSQATGRIGIAW